jgi:spermidine synthase
MRLSQRRGLLIGLALLTSAVVLLETVFARLYAVILGPHIAVAAPTLPLLGLALGGALAFVAPALTRPPRLFARLSTLTSLISATTAIAMIVIVQPSWVEAITTPQPGRLATLYGASFAPFFFAGLVFVAAARHASVNLGKVLASSLAGAAFMALCAGAVVRAAGAPRAGLVAAVLAGAAAVAFFAGGQSRTGAYSQDEEAPSPGPVATFALGAAVLLAGDIGAPWLKLPALRWMRVDRVDFLAWSPRALITVERAQGGVAWMYTDGTAKEPIFDTKKAPDAHVADLAYVLHKDKDRGPVLVIGAGGGLDIRRALKAGQTDIYATEAEEAVFHGVMRGKFSEFTGNLYDRPEVHVAFADGRAFVRSTPLKFRSIILPLEDTSAPLALGALSLTEGRLYTVEAFRDYLERLAPEGTLLVSRFDLEAERLLALAAAGLRKVGVASPKDHLYACAQDRITALVIKRSPLSKKDITTLRSTCKRGKALEIFAPDATRASDLKMKIVTASSPGVAAPTHATDLTPPTDDRPFFFFTKPPHLVPRALVAPRSLVAADQGLLALAVTLAAGLFAAAVVFFGPMITGSARRLRRAAPGGGRVRSLLFFMGLGAAFALAPVALVKHASALLAHPAHAPSIAAAVLLASAALGAAVTDRIPASGAALGAARRVQAITALFAVYAVAYTIGAGLVLKMSAPLHLGVRFAVAAAIQAPLGFLMGSIVSLAIKLVADRAPALVPWCASVGGAAAIVAVPVGSLLAVELGYSSLFIAGAFAFLFATALVPPAPPRPAPTRPLA